MVCARPYTLIFSTMTVDGRIASSTGFSSLSCPYDLYRQRLLRGMVDAVMVGAGTVLVDNPRLVQRLEPETTTYYRVVVDGRLRVAKEAERLRIFSHEPSNVIVFTAVEGEGADKLRSMGVRVHVVGSGGTVDLRKALATLYEEYGVTRLLVEGGGRLSYSLLSAGLVGEVRVTVAPYVFAAGVSVFEDPEGRGFTTTAGSPRLRLHCYELCPCGNCIHLAYRVEEPACPPAGDPPPACLAPRLQRLTAR